MNAQHKKIKTTAVLVYGHVYIIMIILSSQNKITDFLMILAWASPFKVGKAFFSRIFHAVVFTQFGYADSKSAPCQAMFCFFPLKIQKQNGRQNL